MSKSKDHKNRPQPERELIGLEKYMRQYNDSFVNIDELRAEVTKELGKYEARIKLEKSRAKGRRLPDDEGWIEVKSKKRKDLNANDADRRMAKKAKRGNLVNFYSFEIRENKLKRLQEMKERFDEDKKRMALLRSTRKFVYK